MKRRLIIIAVFLLLGAVVNVAVAWGCAVWAPPAPGVDTSQRLANGSHWPRRVPDAWPLPRFGGTAHSFGSTVIIMGGNAGRGSDLYWQGLFQFGQPCRSLEMEIDDVIRSPNAKRTTTWISAGGPMPSALRPRNRVTQFRIPLRPLWAGFAINTIFYAALLWVLIPGAFALRRFLRLRRGLCPKCAYPMGGSSVCTECGCGLAKRAVA